MFTKVVEGKGEEKSCFGNIQASVSVIMGGGAVRVLMTRLSSSGLLSLPYSHRATECPEGNQQLH